MKITFILDNLHAGNAYIRGILPVMGMKNLDIDASYIEASKFKPELVEKNETVVFVKYDRLNQSKIVKQKGGRVILDVVDSKKHWMGIRDYIDALIVNTDSSEMIIRNRFNFEGEIFKIPHIITNFTKDLEGQVRKKLPKVPKNLGYIGVSETFTDNLFFKSFCDENDMNWLFTSASVSSNENSSLQIDLGCINFTHEKERIGGTYTMTKPSAKLINLFSYGIPALFTPYESYLDAIVSYGDKKLLWCVCPTKYAMLDKVKILIENPDLYHDLSDRSFALSRKLHISETKNIYSEIIDYAKR